MLIAMLSGPCALVIVSNAGPESDRTHSPIASPSFLLHDYSHAPWSPVCPTTMSLIALPPLHPQIRKKAFA